MIDIDDIGAEISRVRKARGETVKQLAKRGDMSALVLQDIEAGILQPSISGLRKLARATGVAWESQDWSQRVNSGRTLTLAEVAERLRMTPEQFGSRRGKLYRQGFPRPLQGCGNVWSERRVASWIDGDGESRVDAWHNASHMLVQQDRQALLERYGPDPGGHHLETSPARRAAPRRLPLQAVS